MDGHRATLLDLDGVLFRGDEPIPGAVEALAAIRAAGVATVFVTNNSSRTPEQVAEKLRRLGFEVQASEVVTSALALGEILDGARTAFVIGEDGVREALTGMGVEILEGDPEAADAVVVGWDRAVTYDRLKRASLLVQRGARLLATNSDASYPAPDGLWPGAGALLSVVTTTTGAEAAVAGKPRPAVFRVAARASGTPGPYLVVGDRLETDVAGAEGLGWDSALVLTGVARPPDLLRSAWLPTYVVGSVAGLLEEPARVAPAGREDLGAVRALLEAEGLYAGDLEDRAGDLLVARAGGEVVGAGIVELHGAEALLRSVVVAPARRGRATGVHVVAALVARARRESAGRVWLLTETAEAFFASLGFTAVRRSDLPAEVESSPAAGANCAETAVAMRYEPSR